MRLGAVDVEIDRRVGGGEGREHPGQPGIAVGRSDQSSGHAAHRRRILAFQRFKLIFETAAGRQSNDRRQVERQDAGLADLRSGAEGLPDLRLHRIRRRFPIGERFQPRHHEGVVRLGCAVEQREADDRERMVDGRHLLQNALDLLGHLAGARHRRAVGQLHRNEERALVLLGQEARWRQQGDTEDAACEHQNQHQRQRRHAHQPAHAAGIAVADPVDAAEHTPHDAAPRPGVAQEHGAQCRRQRQRVEGRDHHRRRDRHRELPEQFAGNAGNEGDRHEYRQQHQ